MNQSLWIAKTGLDAQQTKLTTISNNLANASTAGFKRSRAVFEDLLYQRPAIGRAIVPGYDLAIGSHAGVGGAYGCN